MKFFSPTAVSKTFGNFKEAVINGNVDYVITYLTQENCVLSDPMEDMGEPEEDGYISQINNSLLYEAVPHFAVLSVLLQDKRFNPNDNNYDAFYRCLNFGLIDELKLFLAHPSFNCPEDTLIKAAELGGKNLIAFLLSTYDQHGHSLFKNSTISEALTFSIKYHDDDIRDMLTEEVCSLSL